MFDAKTGDVEHGNNDLGIEVGGPPKVLGV